MLRTRHEVRVIEAGGLSFLDDSSIHLTVTSPPYPMIAMWDEIFSCLVPDAARALERNDGPRAFEAMHGFLDTTWRGIFRATVPGGILCLNIGDAARTLGGIFRLYPNHARIVAGCLAAGFESLPLILWRKATNAPNKFMGSGMMPPRAYVTLEHEYILIFRKPGSRDFSKPSKKALRRESGYFWEERNLWFSDLWSFTGVRQTLANEGSRKRSGAFPFLLPYRLINMFSVKGDTVLDPFAGTLTTAVAALCGCRNSVSAEIDEPLAEASIGSMPMTADILNGVISGRIEAHKEFITEYERVKGTAKHRNSHYHFPVVTSQEREIFLNPITAIERREWSAVADYTPADITE